MRESFLVYNKELKMRVPSVNIVAVLLAAVVATANAGNTCRWLGGSGMWTDEACWENGLKPVSGNEDQIYITNGTVGAEITIPDAVVVGNMFISGSQSVHLIAKWCSRHAFLWPMSLKGNWRELLKRRRRWRL